MNPLTKSNFDFTVCDHIYDNVLCVARGCYFDNRGGECRNETNTTTPAPPTSTPAELVGEDVSVVETTIVILFVIIIIIIAIFVGFNDAFNSGSRRSLPRTRNY